MTSWELWAQGVLDQLHVATTPGNVDALWAWSNAETAPYDLMRWNNPLNTTMPWPFARESGAQPGAHDVKIYRTLEDGVGATVATLVNGYYPTIVDHLRAGDPRQQWADACAELAKWGTGCGWINSTYGAAPGNIGGDMPTLDDIQNNITAQGNFLSEKLGATSAALLAAIKAIPSAAGGGLTPAQQVELDKIFADAEATISALRAGLKAA